MQVSFSVLKHLKENIYVLQHHYLVHISKILFEIVVSMIIFRLHTVANNYIRAPLFKKLVLIFCLTNNFLFVWKGKVLKVVFTFKKRYIILYLNTVQ